MNNTTSLAKPRARQNGMTLIEMIVAITLMSIIFGTTSYFLKNAIDSYLLTRQRGEISDLADVALRTMSRDIRGSVPFSVRSNTNKQCLEMIPSAGGGRIRFNSNNTNQCGLQELRECGDGDDKGKVLDVIFYSPFNEIGTAGSGSDEASAKRPLQVDAGDYIIIGALSADNLYVNNPKCKNAGVTEISPYLSSCGVVASWTSNTLPEKYNSNNLGRKIDSHTARLVFANPPTFSANAESHRFFLVKANKLTTTYSCVFPDGSPTIDSAGNGTGKIYQITGDAWQTTPNCDTTNGTLLVDHVSACEFAYDELNGSEGKNPFMGYANLGINITKKHESIELRQGVFVENKP